MNKDLICKVLSVEELKLDIIVVSIYEMFVQSSMTEIQFSL